MTLVAQMSCSFRASSLGREKWRAWRWPLEAEPADVIALDLEARSFQGKLDYSAVGRPFYR